MVIGRRCCGSQWMILLPLACLIFTASFVFYNKPCERVIIDETNRLDTLESSLQAIKRQKDVLLASVAAKEKEIIRLRNENSRQKLNMDHLNEIRRQEIKKEFNSSLPIIYVITPTYTRLTQKADLVRLSQTLQHIKKLHWIVIEDSSKPTKLVTNVLKRSKLTYTQLSNKTPDYLIRKRNEPRWKKPRGVVQRNQALVWLRENSQIRKNIGVVYFADDDNTYDRELFEKMRNIKHVAAWPVGLVGGLRFEGPRCASGKIIGWRAVFEPNRPFPIDMAGFAINVKLLLDNYLVHFNSSAAPGYLESSLLLPLVQDKTKLETITPDCKEVLVWHTKTVRSKLTRENFAKAKYGSSDDDQIEV